MKAAVISRLRLLFFFLVRVVFRKGVLVQCRVTEQRRTTSAGARRSEWSLYELLITEGHLLLSGPSLADSAPFALHCCFDAPSMCVCVCARVCLSEGWIKERKKEERKKTANRRAVFNCAHWDDLKIITFQLASLGNLLCVKRIRRLLFLLCRLNLTEREDVRARRVSLYENHYYYYSYSSTPFRTTWCKRSCSMQFIGSSSSRRKRPKGAKRQLLAIHSEKAWYVFVAAVFVVLVFFQFLVCILVFLMPLNKKAGRWKTQFGQ